MGISTTMTLADTLIGVKLTKKDGSIVAGEDVKNSVVGVYFSAHWCPPCRGFTPVLKKAYEDYFKGKNVEIIFVSSDRTAADGMSYFENDHGDYLMMPHGSDAANQLKKECNVSGIPSLHFYKDGKHYTNDGRSIITDEKRWGEIAP